jgi:PAS domain S-box-containing protein
MDGEKAINLVTSEHVLRAVFESPRDIMVLALDRQYRYVAFNEAHRLGMKVAWNADIAVGQNILDQIGHPALRERSKAHLDRALAGEKFVLVESNIDRYYEIAYFPIVEAGEVIGVTAFHTEITATKRMVDELEKHRAGLETMVAERTAALRRSEALYRTLVHYAPIGVLVHRDGKLLYVNPAAVALCGETDARVLLARRLDDVLLPPVPGGNAIERAMQRSNGERVDVEWTSIGVEFEGAIATLSLALDISSRKRHEEERRRLEEQMLETQKLESLGLLAGGIAHDFNNLLVGVMGNADLALEGIRGGTLTPELVVQLQRIKTAASRAAELTAQMLAYAGKRRFVVGPLDINDIARETADLASVSLPKGAELVLDLAPDVPACEGDAAQIRQIVMNLVTNGAEALDGQAGKITLRTSVVTAEEIQPLAGEEPAAGSYLCLDVTDTGSGMDEATRKRIFDPFFTTKASGRGLGLAAVVGIVRAHHGVIRVTSESGHGSKFLVFLPCSERRVAAAKPPERIEWRRTGTVLIADDEPRVRQVLAMMLKDIGFDVLEAGNAVTCLATYRANAGSIDAIMVDLEMPGGGGREVVRVLRAEGHQVPVIVSSGYSEETVGRELLADPQVAFLEKPFEYATFVRTLQGAINP